MKHNDAADIIRTEICTSWEEEIYNFAANAAPYQDKEKFREVVREYFISIGAIKRAQ